MSGVVGRPRVGTHGGSVGAWARCARGCLGTAACPWLVGMDLAHEGNQGTGLRHAWRASAGVVAMSDNGVGEADDVGVDSSGVA